MQAASQQLPPGFRAATRARHDAGELLGTSCRPRANAAWAARSRGSGSSRNANADGRNTVTLDGVLDAKGTYGLTRVVHRWTRQGYTNDFSCTPWKQYRKPRTAGSAHLERHRLGPRHRAQRPKKDGPHPGPVLLAVRDGSLPTGPAPPAPTPARTAALCLCRKSGMKSPSPSKTETPERPVIIGSLWNGVHTQARADFRGNDIEDNAVKRIMTRSGNRVQFSDKAGVEDHYHCHTQPQQLQADRAGRRHRPEQHHHRVQERRHQPVRAERPRPHRSAALF